MKKRILRLLTALLCLCLLCACGNEAATAPSDPASVAREKSLLRQAEESLSAYFGSAPVPEILGVEEYVHADIEGEPCRLLLVDTAEPAAYAFDLLNDLTVRATEETLDSYAGQLDTKRDICLYFLWVRESAPPYYLNDMEQRSCLTEAELRELNAALAAEAVTAPAETEAAVQEAPQASETTVTLLNWEELPDAFTRRLLSDRDIEALRGADLPELREKISTPADLAAWIDALGTAYFSNISSDENGLRVFDGEDALFWSREMLGAGMVAALAQSILGDDFPGMCLLAASMDYDGGVLVCGNLFPWEGELYVLSVDGMTELQKQSFAMTEIFPPMRLQTVEELISYCGSEQDIACPRATLMQLFCMEGEGPVRMELRGQEYVPNTREGLTELYRDEAYLAGAEERLYGHIRPENIGSYALSEVLGGTTLTAEEAYALLELSPEQVRERVKTAGDVLMYMLAARISDCHGDRTMLIDGQLWHYNLNAFEVMEQRQANCGASANLARYLLDGDYEEIGFILHAYEPGNGGGHVYNYIRYEGKVYIVDFSWYIFADYRPENDFPVMVLDTLEEYGTRVNELYGGVCLVLAHTSEGQHFPNIFADEQREGDWRYIVPAGTEYTVLLQEQGRDVYHLDELALDTSRLDWESFR